MAEQRLPAMAEFEEAEIGQPPDLSLQSGIVCRLTRHPIRPFAMPRSFCSWRLCLCRCARPLGAARPLVRLGFGGHFAGCEFIGLGRVIIARRLGYFLDLNRS